MRSSSHGRSNIIKAREAQVAQFTRARYGIHGTIALHRTALGMDLLRAPLNVALAPFFLLIKLLAALFGQTRVGRWLSRRQVFVKSDVARKIETEMTAFIKDLDAGSIGPHANPVTVRQYVERYAELRNALAEITTSFLVIVAGVLIFNRATPGIISLSTPVAEMRAHASAVNDFILGSGAGRVWYAVFPVELSPWTIIATGVILAVIASLATTFAGLIADPVQVWSGTHRRRVMRLLDNLDMEANAGGIEREHILARLADISDAIIGFWRSG